MEAASSLNNGGGSSRACSSGPAASSAFLGQHPSTAASPWPAVMSTGRGRRGCSIVQLAPRRERSLFAATYRCPTNVAVEGTPGARSDGQSSSSSPSRGDSRTPRVAGVRRRQGLFQTGRHRSGRVVSLGGDHRFVAAGERPGGAAVGAAGPSVAVGCLDDEIAVRVSGAVPGRGDKQRRRGTPPLQGVSMSAVPGDRTFCSR